MTREISPDPLSISSTQFFLSFAISFLIACFSVWEIFAMDMLSGFNYERLSYITLSILVMDGPRYRLDSISFPVDLLGSS